MAGAERDRQTGMEAERERERERGRGEELMRFLCTVCLLSTCIFCGILAKATA